MKKQTSGRLTKKDFLATVEMLDKYFWQCNICLNPISLSEAQRNQNKYRMIQVLHEGEFTSGMAYTLVHKDCANE